MKGLRSEWIVGIVLVILAAAGIGIVQPRLATDIKQGARRDDIFVLPPPNQLRAMTLGYKAAAADLLWAKLIVEHGVHWEERRAFPDIPNYVDGILALDPDHTTVYEFVDTLLLFTPVGGTEADARRARSYLERGTRQRPYDPDAWLRYGQFMAYLAPSYVKDPNEVEQWKRDGAFAIGRAVELGADADRSLAATSILSKTGERAAAIKHLQHAYALTDDLETRRQIKLKLESLAASVESEATLGIVEHEWRTRFPFASRGTTLLLGPYRDPSACAGPTSRELRKCPQDWAQVARDAR
jgi:hypothetical protein